MLYQHSYAHLLKEGIGAEAAESQSKDRFADLYEEGIDGSATAAPLTLRQFFTNVGLEDEMQTDYEAAQASQSDSTLGRP